MRIRRTMSHSETVLIFEIYIFSQTFSFLYCGDSKNTFRKICLKYYVYFIVLCSSLHVIIITSYTESASYIKPNAHLLT